eukprot:jgi/Mesvir1/7334/Mv19143-RA.2
MNDEEIDKIVLSYLLRKGYRNAEQQFRAESKMLSVEDLAAAHLDADTSIANQILFYCSGDNAPSRYAESFGKLREWVHSSLDQYKGELSRVLYPMMVHCYLELVAKDCFKDASLFLQHFRVEHDKQHAHELAVLEGISLPQHVQENALARMFRENKIDVRLSQYSLELLLSFLHSMGSMLLLRILNERLNIKVHVGQPSFSGPHRRKHDDGEEEEEEEWVGADGEDTEEAITVTGISDKSLEAMNQREIRWGILEDSLEAKALDQERGQQAAEAGTKDDASKPPPAKKQAVKDKDKDAAVAATRTTGISPAFADIPRVKSAIPLPKLSERAELDILNDLRQQVRVTATALPSVCFFTFANTYNGLNGIALSSDGQYVAGGFADSSVKLWSLNQKQERSKGAAPASGPAAGAGVNATPSPGAGVGAGLGPYRSLRAHSDAVFGLDFSSDNQFLLSSSSDNTVRLWSLELGANLVAYRGHAYPVWDVQFSPLGYYFASASHDKTARIWSTERPAPLRILAGHLADVDCVRWHPNCNYVATGSADKTVRLWDIQTGECLRLFPGHYGAVMALAMSPDARTMASAGEDGLIHIWDLGSGKRMSTLSGHTGAIWSLSYRCVCYVGRVSMHGYCVLYRHDVVALLQVCLRLSMWVEFLFTVLYGCSVFSLTPSQLVVHFFVLDKQAGPLTCRGQVHH